MNNKVRITILILLMMITQLIVVNTYAAVTLSATKKLVLPADPSTPIMTEATKNRIIPKQVGDATGYEFLNKMMDNTLSLWWETSPLRNTSVGRAADTVEKKLNVKAEFEDRNQVKHNFNFKFLAMQALARIEYKGWVRAALNYDTRAARTIAEVSENVGDSKSVVLSHAMSKEDQNSALSFRWSW